MKKAKIYYALIDEFWRKEQKFDQLEQFGYNLGSDVRKKNKLSGTTHNVFGIQVGVSVNIFIKTLNVKLIF